ncbi:MAG: hypothetical protein K2W95_08885 [Candidatus Obscuribacterales bacterium]|nr:hypothetical protein [Candidatus Obscuribacterales bacterium]
MNSRKQVTRIRIARITAGLSISLIFAAAARAEMTPAQVEKVALAAKVLPAGAKVTGRAINSEVVLSTYANAKVFDNDLKIDAVLLAKAFIEADKSVAKVIVHFYNTQNPQTYRTVVVRNTDVKAFGMGLVEKNTLLEAIDVVRNEPTANGQRTKSQTGVSQSVGNGQVKHTVDGITFLFPSSWIEKQSGSDKRGETINLFRATAPLPSAYVELKVFTAPGSLRQIFESKKDAHSKALKYEAIALTPSITFGRNRTVSGFQFACSYLDRDTHKESHLYERHVCFSHANRVFKLKLRSTVSDAKLMNEAFDQLLSSVSLQR